MLLASKQYTQEERSKAIATIFEFGSEYVKRKVLRSCNPTIEEKKPLFGKILNNEYLDEKDLKKFWYMYNDDECREKVVEEIARRHYSWGSKYWPFVLMSLLDKNNSLNKEPIKKWQIPSKYITELIDSKITLMLLDGTLSRERYENFASQIERLDK